jgi:phage regulator Rha-like protein
MSEIAILERGPAVATLTMSSREIAELVESRHDSVKRTIERLAEKGVIGVPPTVEYKDGLGRPATEYQVGKRDSYIIVAQLLPEFTARLVDRWQELESAAAAAAPAIPPNYAAALRLAADMAEQKERAEAQLAIAAPKVAALDRIATADGLLNLTGAAKALQQQPVKFCESLRQLGWIYRRAGGKSNVAYQDKIQAGYLTHKTTTVTRNDGTEKICEQVLVTPKGLTKLAVLIGAGMSV